MGEALGMLESAMGFLADADAAQMPAEALAECLRAVERADAVEAAARGRLLVAFDAKNGHLADGQRTCRTWLIHSLRITTGQAAEHKAVEALAREHRPLLGGPARRARRHQVDGAAAGEMAAVDPGPVPGGGGGVPGHRGPGRGR
jgi:hypothetical protein